MGRPGALRGERAGEARVAAWRPLEDRPPRAANDNRAGLPLRLYRLLPLLAAAARTLLP